MKRVHIIGSGPRTGTTLLTEAMKVCFNIDAYPDHEASICLPNSEIANETDSIVLSKAPREIHLMQWALAVDRSLYVICIMRDPRDMIVSKHGKRPNDYYCNLTHWMKFVTYYQKLKHHDRFLLISYEEFVTSPDLVQNRINDKFRFLEKEHLFSKYHEVSEPGLDSKKALNGMRPINARGIGNWKNHKKRVKDQLMKFGDISQELINFDYEQNKNWLNDMNINWNEDEHTLKLINYKRVKRKGYYSSKLIITSNVILEKFGLKPKTILRPYKELIKNLFYK